MAEGSMSTGTWSLVNCFVLDRVAKPSSFDEAGLVTTGGTVSVGAVRRDRSSGPVDGTRLGSRFRLLPERVVAPHMTTGLS